MSRWKRDGQPYGLQGSTLRRGRQTQRRIKGTAIDAGLATTDDLFEGHGG